MEQDCGGDYDVAVVGAGLMGCFVARNLARWRLRVTVLERNNDLCMGISRANSAIVYSGADTKPDTLKTRLTVEGNRAFDRLCAELGVPFVRCGSLMVACGPRGEKVLARKLEQGVRNGVEGLRLLDAEAVRALEPHIAKTVTAALYAPTTGTVNPWELCIAAAQNAHANGVAFFFEHEVVGIERVVGNDGQKVCGDGASGAGDGQKGDGSLFVLRAQTPAGQTGQKGNRPPSVLFRARSVVNCAGLCADLISESVAPVSFRFKPTRGDYLILDETARGFINHVIFHEPEEKAKGATLVPTVDGNIMVGPSEDPAGDGRSGAGGRADERGSGGAGRGGAGGREYAFPTTAEGLAFNRRVALHVFPALPLAHTIRNFSTLRPNIYWAAKDAEGAVRVSDESISTFYIAEAKGCPGFINVAGIKTPGLTCADGIGRHVAELVCSHLGAGEDARRNAAFSPVRAAPVRFSRLDLSVAEDGSLSRSLAQPPHLPTAPQSSHLPIAPHPPQPPTAPHPCHTSSDLPDGFLGDLEIACRCKQVTAGEVRRAIREPLGARTVDGVKRRTGAGMGRCQGGFCTERVIKLLAEERGCPSNEVLKDGSGSVLVVGVGSASEANGADAAGAVGVGDASATGAVGVGNASATGNTCVSSGLASKIGSTPFSPQLLIVGGGGAGIAAALAAHETGVAAKDLLLVDRHPYLGGILPQCLHAGFGVRTHAGELNGPEFLRPLVARFEALEIPHFLRSSVLKIALDHTVMLATSEGFARMRPRALVLATGCRERACGSLPIAGMRPAGIFTAGAAQKMVNVNGWNVGERFVVLGSGDVGLIMAGRFAALGKDVVAVLEQGARCGGLHRNRVRYLDKYGIPLLTHSTITQVFGTTRVTGVEVQTREPNGTTRRWELACDTLITSVGLICETDLLGGMKDAEGVRHQGEPLAAPPPWVFVAGNARKVRPFIEDVIDDGTAVGRAAARLT